MNKRPFKIDPTIIIPRDARRVYCPIEDCPERVVSDLMPVDAITEDWPVIGTTTYGEIEFFNKPDENYFAGYVLRKIEADRPFFSRLTFSRDIPLGPNGGEFENPYKVETETADHYWPPILHDIQWIPNPAFPIYTRGDRGEIITGYRHEPREIYTPPAREGTLFKYEYFVHSSPPNIPRYPVPLPTRVSVTYMGGNVTFEECLHDELKVKSRLSGTKSYSAATSVSIGIGGVLPGMLIPATNFTTWRKYYKDHKPTKNDVLWQSVRVSVSPPRLPETIIGA